MSQVIHNIFGSVGQAKEPAKVVDPLDDLKSLIELGCIEDDVTIGDKVFRLKTLNLVDRIRLSSMLSAESTREQVIDFQINLLASAIVSINGKPLESLHPDLSMDPLKQRVDILSTLQSPVINILVKAYEEMLLRCDTQFDAGQIKK
jgi:hypothetical protein